MRASSRSYGLFQNRRRWKSDTWRIRSPSSAGGRLGTGSRARRRSNPSGTRNWKNGPGRVLSYSAQGWTAQAVGRVGSLRGRGLGAGRGRGTGEAVGRWFGDGTGAGIGAGIDAGEG